MKLRSSISASEPVTSFSRFDMLSPIATAARQGHARTTAAAETRFSFVSGPDDDDDAGLLMKARSHSDSIQRSRDLH